MIVQAASLLILALAPAQDQRLDADRLVEEAWRFLPAYDGTHRYSLPPEVQSETRAGAHLLEAALALKPDHVRALWSLGHANILLAEDARNRHLDVEAGGYHDRAVESLTRAIDLQPTDPWALYARGTAHASVGQHELALADLTRSIENATAQLETAVDNSSTAWLRFKAIEWRAEVLMRSGAGERARDELRAFHADFSTNEWPLSIALAESYERERDFASARDVYEELLPKFPADHQAYALLGYLEGLVGDRERASTRLFEALQRELEPGLYPRLWFWILATDEHREAAEADLGEFLASPPSRLSAWDRRLGAFVLGEGTAEEFSAAAAAEVERRLAAGEPLDDLRCEARFYLGLRLEEDAHRTEDEAARRRLLDGALAAYADALSFDPYRWKWEWAYARVRFASLARRGRIVEEGFGALGSLLEHRGVTGILGVIAWHVPGTEAPVATLGRPPEPGDLLLGVLCTQNGRRIPVRVVAGIR